MRKSAFNIYKSIRSGNEGMADKLIESTLNEKAKGHLRNIIVNESPLNEAKKISMKEIKKLRQESEKLLDKAQAALFDDKIDGDQALEWLNKAIENLNKMTEYEVNESTISMKDLKKLRKNAEKLLDKAQAELYKKDSDDEKALDALDKALENLNKMISTTSRDIKESSNISDKVLNLCKKQKKL